MADLVPSAKSLDPKAALEKYTYPGADSDQKIIDKVELAIASRFPANYVEGFADGVSAEKAGVSEKDAQEQKAKADEQAKQERLEHPDDVKKEEQQSPPGKLDAGPPVKPTVPTPGPVKTAAAPQPKKGPAGPAGGGKAGGSGKITVPKGGGEKLPAPPTPIVMRAAEVTDFDGYLNTYPSKSPETKEQLSKIAEMSNIAKTFDRQVEAVVPHDGDSAIGTYFKGQLGKSELAAFTDNPYAKVEGGLGTLMRVLSKIGAVVSIVGNIAGKLGMILTIVGLFAMIFPPLGGAIEAIARVLNIVGLICDALGLIINGVLVGLNGVVLAKQIGKGASNEEKAATADLMMSEATSAGGHVINLAMHYGPKFMKGFKGASKGVVGQLFAKAKGVIAKFGSKTLGEAGNWAKNILYKVGIGVGAGESGKVMKALGAGAGYVKKAGSAVWHAPGKILDRVHDVGWVKKVNQSGAMQAVERFGGKVDHMVDNNKFLKFVDSGFGEKAGEAVSNMGSNPQWAKKLEASAKADQQAARDAIERNAMVDAGNKQAGRIDKQIRSKFGSSIDKSWEGDAEGAAKDYKAVKHLEANRQGAIDNAEGNALLDAKAGTVKREQAEAETSAKEAAKEKEAEEFKNDPAAFQAETKKKMEEWDKEKAKLGLEKSDLKYKKAQINKQLEDDNLSKAEKKQLNAEKAKLDSEIAEKKQKISEIRHESNERQMVSTEAAGGEAPEHLWHAKEKVAQLVDAAGKLADPTHKTEEEEKGEERKKVIEESTGHKDFEQNERVEQRQTVQKWSKDESAGSGWQSPSFAPPAASDYVMTVLANLDDETGGDHDDDHENDSSNEPQDSGPANDDAKDGGAANDNDGGAPGAQAAAPAAAAAAPGPAPGPAGDEAKEGKAEIPELAYWPDLTKKGGDFDQGAQQLYRMKQIAYAFYKQQVEGKKKAIQTAGGLADAAEYADAKAKIAAEHKKAMGAGIDEQKGSSAAAATSANKAGEGENKQNESKSKGEGAKQDAPDPGEKPSRWHPIKRIWWYVKKWASEAAAKVFGFIQEKIGSLIMQMICGVSMGDMKDYTAALHRRSEFSAIKGKEGEDVAQKTIEAQQNTVKESHTAVEECLADAAECDQNMADANAFIAAIEKTEKELAEEQQRAVQFIASLKAAVAAEKARKAEQAGKLAAAAATAAVVGGAAGGAMTAGPAAAPAAAATAAAAPAVAGAAKKKAEKKQKPVSAAGISKVQSAASYVSKQADLVVQQLQTSRQSQSIQLGQKLEEAEKAKGVDTTTIGGGVITEMTAQAATVKAQVSGISTGGAADNAALQQSANHVKEHAKSLDESSAAAFQHLNFLFKSTYDMAMISKAA